MALSTKDYKDAVWAAHEYVDSLMSKTDDQVRKDMAAVQRKYDELKMRAAELFSVPENSKEWRKIYGDLRKAIRPS